MTDAEFKEKIILRQIEIVAGKYSLSSNVVYGVAMTESSMDPLAARHEPGYPWLYKPEQYRPRDCSPITETILQQTSWGLMQVMGATLREMGYRGWLTAVPGDPALQLDYGCRYLKRKIDRFGVFEGLLAYNAGSPRRKADGEYVNYRYARNVAEFAQQALSDGIFPNSKDDGVPWLTAVND